MAELLLPGTSTDSDVLSGYTFSSSSSAYNVAGTMINQGSLVNPNAGFYSAGYYESISFYLSPLADYPVGPILGLNGGYDDTAGLSYGAMGSASNVIDSLYGLSSSNVWTTLAANTVTGAAYSASSAFDTSASLFYIIDGLTSSNSYLSNLAEYSNTSNAWTAGPNDSEGGRDSLAAAFDTNAALAYAFGGFNGSNVATLTAYSHSTGSWSTLASLLSAISDIAGNYFSGLTLTGCAGGSTNTSSFTMYSYTSNAWTAYSSVLETAIINSGIGYLSSTGLVYSFGGLNDSSGMGNAYLVIDAYSFTNNAWTDDTNTLHEHGSLGYLVNTANASIVMIAGGELTAAVEAYKP